MTESPGAQTLRTPSFSRSEEGRAHAKRHSRLKACCKCRAWRESRCRLSSFFCFYPRVFTYLPLFLFLALVLGGWAFLPLKGGNPFPFCRGWFGAEHAAQYRSGRRERVSAAGLPGKGFLLPKKETLKGQFPFRSSDRVRGRRDA